MCVCVCANAEGGDDHKLFMTDGRLFSRLLGQARYRESPVRPWHLRNSWKSCWTAEKGATEMELPAAIVIRTSSFDTSVWFRPFVFFHVEFLFFFLNWFQLLSRPRSVSSTFLCYPTVVLSNRPWINELLRRDLLQWKKKEIVKWRGRHRRIRRGESSEREVRTVIDVKEAR